MAETLRLTLMPNQIVTEVPLGTRLRDVLGRLGVEFPCGCRGVCKGCRVRVLEGELAPEPSLAHGLDPELAAAGWRMACQHRMESDLCLQVKQWVTPVLTDEQTFAFTPQAGLGIAVDLGTTTLATQLLDLSTAQVLAVKTGLNPQARFGADIMSRVQYAVGENGQRVLETLIRKQIGRLLRELLETAGLDTQADLVRVVVAGNSVMHHLFGGIDLEALSHYPFETEMTTAWSLPASELHWQLPGTTPVELVPVLGSFVGGDILAGILATGLDQATELCALIDLGTNGEMVVGMRDRLLYASTAAGPAFEAARISMGMQAVTGAISEVQGHNGSLQVHVIGGGEPEGICGSGLVDAVATGLVRGDILPSGRIADRRQVWPLAGEVGLHQCDIRELQLAKGAIAAGMHILLDRWGARPADIQRVYLAGAFGNYIRRESARLIGMLPFAPDQIFPAGNTSLRGAKQALFLGGAAGDWARRIQAISEHVSLHADPEFQDIYIDEMSFRPHTEESPA